MISSDFSSLEPIHFFRLHVEVKKKKTSTTSMFNSIYFLPNTSDLLNQDPFGDVALCWSEKGIHVAVHMHKKFEEASYPEFEKGDAVELFFDTRDMKNGGLPSRFCHHFLVLPQEVQGIRALEMTRFRADESHPLCDPDKIEMKFKSTSKDYFLDIFFPEDILHGYNPTEFNRIGFTYTLHGTSRRPQNFALSSEYVSIAQNPSLWASCQLI